MNQELLQIANKPIFWILCSFPVFICLLQSIFYIRLSKKTAKEVGLSQEQCNSAFRSGLINAIGPSIGVFIVLVAMMSVIGGPMAWQRLSIIGSAGLESVNAEIGAKVYGVEFGGAGYDLKAMIMSWFILAFGTQGWIWFIILFTPSMEKIKTKIVSKDAAFLNIVTTAAMVAVFGNLSTGRILQSVDVAASVFAGAGIMVILHRFVNPRFPILKEYSMGIAMLGAMVIASLVKVFLA